MWTHNITQKSIEDGQLRVIVGFTDGAIQFDRIYFPNSLIQLKNQIQNELDRLESQDILKESVNLGTIDLTIITTPPSDAQLAQQVYDQKRSDLFKAKLDLDLGLLLKADYDLLVQDALSCQPIKVTP